MNPTVIAFSFAESVPFGCVVVIECAHIGPAWHFRNQPAPAMITSNGELAEHALFWSCIKISH